MRLVCRVNKQKMDDDEQSAGTLHKTFVFGLEITNTEIIDSRKKVLQFHSTF